MNWKTRFLILTVLSIPAFTGYPLKVITVSVLPGITWGWVGYFLGVNVLIGCILGSKHLANVISMAALIALPIVFVGGTISHVMHISGFESSGLPHVYSVHYVSLALTMLTVIPLSLSMVGVIPFHEIEQNLLSSPTGVSKIEKVLLMFLRVFNHILYFVLPNVFEVMREEGRFQLQPHPEGNRMPSQKTNLARLIRVMTRMGIEGICSAIQYVPLWAVEISQLPERKTVRKRKIET